MARWRSSNRTFLLISSALCFRWLAPGFVLLSHLNSGSATQTYTSTCITPHPPPPPLTALLSTLLLSGFEWSPPPHPPHPLRPPPLPAVPAADRDHYCHREHREHKCPKDSSHAPVRCLPFVFHSFSSFSVSPQSNHPTLTKALTQ